MCPSNIDSNDSMSATPKMVDGVYFIEPVSIIFGFLNVRYTSPVSPDAEPYIIRLPPHQPMHATTKWTVKYNSTLQKYAIISALQAPNGEYYRLKAYEDSTMSPPADESVFRVRLTESKDQDESAYWNIMTSTHGNSVISNAKYPHLFISINYSDRVFLVEGSFPEILSSVKSVWGFMPS